MTGYTNSFWSFVHRYLLVVQKYIVKMSLELFHKVPVGAIETIFDEQNQPLFKRDDLRKYLGMRNIRDNFKDFKLHRARPRSEIEGVVQSDTLGRAKNHHDIFINLDSAIKIAVCSKKMSAIALLKWLTAIIALLNDELKSLEFSNEEHEHQINEDLMKKLIIS